VSLLVAIIPVLVGVVAWIIRPRPKPEDPGDSSVSDKAIHLAGTWSGKLNLDKYELQATLDVRSGRVSGKIHWTLVDPGKNRWLAKKKPNGSTGWEAVDGTLKSGKLSLHGGIVSDKDLLAEGGEYSLTLNGDGTFIGSYHVGYDEYAYGILEGTFDEV
jgi:hypothetical protein